MKPLKLSLHFQHENFIGRRVGGFPAWLLRFYYLQHGHFRYLISVFTIESASLVKMSRCYVSGISVLEYVVCLWSCM